MKMIFLLTVSCLLFTSLTFGQFGRNKVQYRSYTWYYIQTTHFDIYFTEEGAKIAEFTADAAETALASIQRKMNYRINNRLSIILYNSQNDFQETNIIDENLSEGTGGFTELFKNRVVLPFTGSYKLFRHVIHHELVHAVMNDMFYGGSIQNIISNNISIRFPLWLVKVWLNIFHWVGILTPICLFVMLLQVFIFLILITSMAILLIEAGRQFFIT